MAKSLGYVITPEGSNLCNFSLTKVQRYNFCLRSSPNVHVFACMCVCQCVYVCPRMHVRVEVYLPPT